MGADLGVRRFVFFHEHSHEFDGLAASRVFTATLGTDEVGSVVQGSRVTQHFFQVIGMRPVQGRPFSGDDFADGAAPVAIVSHEVWTTKLASHPAPIGRPIHLDDRPYTVVGVMPPAFELSRPAGWSGVLVPERFRGRGEHPR